MTLTYKGYQFPEQSHIVVSTEFVYDDAERTVTHHRYTITIDAIIAQDPQYSSLGAHALSIRQLLSKPGGHLTLDHGFGPLDVNGSTSDVQDVNFGPKPRILDWNPIGHTNAAEMRWQCEVCVPVCDGTSSPRYRGLAALNYSISYAINVKGFSTRTVTGYLKIAMTRSGRNIPDTADRYRDLVKVTKPDNFRREQQDWKLSDDKLRADFTVVDRQVESRNAYPPGVINIRGNHRAGWARRRRAYLPNTISVEIELAHDQPTSRAWDIFIAIINDRLSYNHYDNKPVFLEELDVNEDLFGTTVSFSINYRIAADIKELFNVTGIFRPLSFHWYQWASSIAGVTGNRGVANLAHSPAEDRITDLCDNGAPTTQQPLDTGRLPPLGIFPRLENKRPAPEYSWLRFEASLTEETHYLTVFQTTLGSVTVARPAFSPGDPDPKLNTIDMPGVETTIAEAPPDMRWRWTGVAERVGYPVAIPDKLKIGDVTLERVGTRRVANRHLGTHFGVPLYGAAWDLQYRVTTRPVKLDAANPDPAAVAP